jgi:hypothetical protein
MAKRINVILPDATIRTIDRLARPGERSRLIAKAVRHYAATQSTEAIREQLKQTSIRDRDLDLEITDEWLTVDRETCQQIDPEHPRKTPGRAAAKSISRRST